MLEFVSKFFEIVGKGSVANTVDVSNYTQTNYLQLSMKLVSQLSYYL